MLLGNYPIISPNIIIMLLQTMSKSQTQKNASNRLEELRILKMKIHKANRGMRYTTWMEETKSTMGMSECRKEIIEDDRTMSQHRQNDGSYS